MERKVTVSLISGKPSLLLYYGTEDQVSVPVKAYKRCQPYAVYNGIRYELTEDEKNTLREMMDISKTF